jgi:hypothetical protein
VIPTASITTWVEVSPSKTRSTIAVEIYPEHGIIVQVAGWYDDDGKLALAVICKIEIAWSGEIATIKIIHILNELISNS